MASSSVGPILCGQTERDTKTDKTQPWKHVQPIYNFCILRAKDPGYMTTSRERKRRWPSDYIQDIQNLQDNSSAKRAAIGKDATKMLA